MYRLFSNPRIVTKVRRLQLNDPDTAKHLEEYMKDLRKSKYYTSSIKAAYSVFESHLGSPVQPKSTWYRKDKLNTRDVITFGDLCDVIDTENVLDMLISHGCIEDSRMFEKALSQTLGKVSFDYLETQTCILSIPKLVSLRKRVCIRLFILLFAFLLVKLFPRLYRN